MRLRRIYGAPVAAVSMSVEGETAAYAAAVVANGGTVSDARVAILNTFIRAEKASGAWALTDDYWGLWAENEAQALTSLKQRRLATVVAAPTFTADAGYAFNGTTQYANTGFIPSTNGVNCTGTNQRLGVYERTNVSSTGNTAGTVDIIGSQSLILVPRNASVATARVNSAALSFTLSPQDSRGLKVVSRTGAAARLYDRGVRLTDATGLTVGTSAPASNLFVGARSNLGVAESFRACSVGFVCIGGQLTDAQETAHYSAVQAWATAVGAQV